MEAADDGLEAPPPSDATFVGTVPPEDDAPQADAANATMVFDTRSMSRKGVAAGPPAKLVLLKGPKKGTEFTLGAGETSLGRNSDNTIVVPDISVSRRHVVIEKRGESYVLIDQGSGNGTLMNGGKVEGEHPLSDGDVFLIGDTEIQFVAPGGATVRSRSGAGAAPAAAASSAPPRRATRQPQRAVVADDEGPAEGTGRFRAGGASSGGGSKSKRPLIVAGIGSVVVVGILAVASMKQKNNQAAEVAMAQAQEAQAASDASNALYAAGKDLARKNQWDAALEKFKAAKAAGADARDLDDYIERATAEQKYVGVLKGAQENLEKKLIGAAYSAAKQIPDSSILSEEAVKVVTAAKAQFTERAAEAKTKTASLSKDLKGAQEYLAVVTDALLVDPANTDLSKAQSDLNETIEVCTKYTSCRRPVGPKTPEQLAAEKNQAASAHSGEIITAFKSGDVAGAKALSKQYGETEEPAKQLGADIAKLESLMEKAETDPNAAKEARALDKRLTGGAGSSFTKKLANITVSVALKKGIAAKSSGNLKEAYRWFSEAADADSSNIEAKSQIEQLKNQAKEIFMAGYVNKSADPEMARTKFQQVIDITPQNDEYNQKARNALRDLGGN